MNEMITTKGYSSCKSAYLSTINVDKETAKEICTETFLLLIAEMRNLRPALG